MQVPAVSLWLLEALSHLDREGATGLVAGTDVPGRVAQRGKLDVQSISAALDRRGVEGFHSPTYVRAHLYACRLEFVCIARRSLSDIHSDAVPLLPRKPPLANIGRTTYSYVRAGGGWRRLEAAGGCSGMEGECCPSGAGPVLVDRQSTYTAQRHISSPRHLAVGARNCDPAGCNTAKLALFSAFSSFAKNARRRGGQHLLAARAAAEAPAGDETLAVKGKRRLRRLTVARCRDAVTVTL